MTMRDPYDITVAFDDVFDKPFEADVNLTPVYVGVAGRISRRGKPPVRFDVVNLTGAMPSFASHLVDPDHFVVGAEAIERFPLFASYYQRFVNALPSTKIVRLDKRVSFLEDALAKHVSDGHGEDLIGAEMSPIPVKDSVCFRIGREVHCAVKTLTGAYLSTSKSVLPAAADVLDIAGMCGCEDLEGCAEELLGCAEYLTGDQLARELRACLPRVAYVRTPLVGVIRSTMDPAVCATEALLRTARTPGRLQQAHSEISALQACCGMLVEQAARSR